MERIILLSSNIYSKKDFSAAIQLVQSVDPLCLSRIEQRMVEVLMDTLGGVIMKIAEQ